MSEEQAKPNPHDPELVGREDVFKYISVRNWGKFQKEFKTKRRPYVMDDCAKDSQAEYQRLSVNSRYFVDAGQRQIGLHGQNMRNSVSYVSAALSLQPRDRLASTQSIRCLVAVGWYVLTNESSPFSKELNNEVTNGIAPEAQASPVKDKRNPKDHPTCQPYRVNTGCALCSDTPGFENRYGGDCVCVKVYTDKTKRHEITLEEAYERMEAWQRDHN